MKAHIHYEAAFEHYLQAHQVPYVAVDEAKRAAFHDARLKSFDFIVYSSNGANWLVDIKGRRWAVRRGSGRPAWQNWVTQADLDGLREWEAVFGPGFSGLLVFAYRLETEAQPPPEIIHEFQRVRYVFAGVARADYATDARRRSPKWGTVNLSVPDFARHVRPIADWL